MLCVVNFQFSLYEIYVQNQNTDGQSSIAVRIECLFTVFIPILICELCMKNEEGEAEIIFKLNGVAYITWKNMKKNL